MSHCDPTSFFALSLGAEPDSRIFSHRSSSGKHTWPLSNRPIAHLVDPSALHAILRSMQEDQKQRCVVLPYLPQVYIHIFSRIGTHQSTTLTVIMNDDAVPMIVTVTFTCFETEVRLFSTPQTFRYGCLYFFIIQSSTRSPSNFHTPIISV